MLRRRGFTILELTVAMIILGGLMSLCLKWVAATGGQAREARWHQRALCEASNVMERLAAQTWDEVSPEHAAKISLSEEARQALPGGAVAVQVAQAPGDPQAKAVAVTVRWRPRADTPEANVRLVAWKFRKVK